MVHSVTNSQYHTLSDIEKLNFIGMPSKAIEMLYDNSSPSVHHSTDVTAIFHVSSLEVSFTERVVAVTDI